MALLTPSNLKAVKFTITGLEEYLKNIEAAGNSVDAAVMEALEESAKPIYEDIEAWAKKHKLTGATLEGIVMSEVKRDGNYFYVEVGIDSDKNYGAWHAVFVEYGTPKMRADPGIRRAYSSNKSKVKKLQQQIFERKGTGHG